MAKWANQLTPLLRNRQTIAARSCHLPLLARSVAIVYRMPIDLFTWQTRQERHRNDEHGCGSIQVSLCQSTVRQPHFLRGHVSRWVLHGFRCPLPLCSCCPRSSDSSRPHTVCTLLLLLTVRTVCVAIRPSDFC